jgi:hypothetical protein
LKSLGDPAALADQLGAELGALDRCHVEDHVEARSALRLPAARVEIDEVGFRDLAAKGDEDDPAAFAYLHGEHPVILPALLSMVIGGR